MESMRMTALEYFSLRGMGVRERAQWLKRFRAGEMLRDIAGEYVREAAERGVEVESYDIVMYMGGALGRLMREETADPPRHSKRGGSKYMVD